MTRRQVKPTRADEDLDSALARIDELMDVVQRTSESRLTARAIV